MPIRAYSYLCVLYRHNLGAISTLLDTYIPLSLKMQMLRNSTSSAAFGKRVSKASNGSMVRSMKAGECISSAIASSLDDDVAVRTPVRIVIASP